MSAVEQPSGTVTLVFTDIEGSTRLLEELGVGAYKEALAEHRRIVREACARHEGYEVDTEGDAFFYAFATAGDAVRAVGEAMHGLAGGPIRIRVGLHTGEPALDPPGYVGLDVHRAARVMSSAHGGQVVLSPTTVALLERGTVELKHLGEHRLKDLSAPIPLHQLALEGLEHEFPPLKTLYRSNLPIPTTPFLGRETELATVTGRLLDPTIRLLTLTGPGGTGKTRLALQAAAAVSERFPDGVSWVPLAPLRDPGLVVPAIAATLDVAEVPGEALGATVVSVLAGGRRLLLLDNLEHLLPGVADDVSHLLASCPTVLLVVTSRERLHLESETVWPVPPLADSDGQALFVDRALAAGVELEVDGTIVELCRRLDELPLAIQLAAARTRSLSPSRILESLVGQHGILASSSRDVDARQRTLEATINWSYGLLEPEEQRVLRGLSVFAGGCTLDAAARVVGADLDLLEGLLDKSLLRHATDGLGADRYWMLETIRDFAARRLEDAGESAAVLEAFLDWLDALTGEVDGWWLDRDQHAWFRALDDERANLMQGIARCRAHGRHERAVRLLVAAHEYIDAWGPYTPFAELLHGEPCGDPSLDGRARLLSVFLSMRLGRFVEAAEEAARESRSEDLLLRGRFAGLHAFLVLQLGEPERAVALASEALELARGADDPRGIAFASNSLALAEMTVGDDARAESHLRESDAIFSAYGDARNARIARGNVALVLLAARKPDEASVLLRQVMDDVRLLEGPAMTAHQLGNLAIGLAAARDTTGARAALREAMELDTAQFEQALAVEGLLVLGIAAAHDGAPELAALLWGAAEAARVRFDYVLGPELEVYVTDVLEPLRSRPDFEEHSRRGQSLTADEAIALGLEPPERDPSVASTSSGRASSD